MGTTDHLKDYITSEGMRLPPDVSKFARNGDFSEGCLFCGQPHDHISVYQYTGPPDASTGLLTGAHCCDNCYYDIHRMEQSFVGMSPRDNLLSDESWTPERRRHEYSTNGQFDDTVHICYTHMAEEVAPFRDKCYFCQITQDYNYSFTVEVPVSASHRMTGGKVRCCAKCRFKMERDKVGFDVATWSKLKSPTDICQRCTQGYLVGHDEYQNRVFLGHLGKHLCPKCTYDRCTVHSVKDVLITKNNNLTFRYSTPICQFCTRPFRFDKTSSIEIAKVYTREGKAICRKCGEYAEPPVHALLAGDYFIRVFSYNKDMYVVTKTAIGSEKEHVYHFPKKDILSQIEFLVNDDPSKNRP